MLTVIKLLHTVIWAFLAGCILALPVLAVFQRFRWAAIITVVLLLECGVLVVNRGRCPLTDLAAFLVEEGLHGVVEKVAGELAEVYDLPQYRPFWATVQQLDVPFYLHPRFPLTTRQQAYEGHAWITGSAWGFAVETSIHALRLMGSGLFDEYPKLKVILGHLGEGLPFGIWRVDHRIARTSVRPKAKLPIAHYLRENFYITTSGAFRTQALIDTIMEVGADRVLYSVDYPYEDMGEAAEWFDDAPISEPDRLKIACGDARQLFHL
jgi:2,3-dihydroxybenzoate decarboxylase